MFRITAYDREGRQVAAVDAAAGEVTIGRETDRRICLPSPSVSRRHARIVLDGPQPFIADEGSSNGVLVNGVRIAGPTALVPGVRIDIAEYWLDFSALAQTAQPAHYTPPPVQPHAQVGGAGGEPLRLRAEGGPFAGRLFDVPAGRVAIGRAIDNDLVFDDPSLSRKHAEMQIVAPDRVEIRDLGSSNGTWVNGRKIEAAHAGVGDAIRLGDLMFLLEGDPSLREVSSTYSEEVEAAPPRSRTALYVTVTAVVVIAGGAIAAMVIRGGGGGGGGAGAAHGPAANPVEQVELHLKTGRDRLADRQFDAAVAEFDRVLEIDPTNGEARRLRVQADNEPKNEKQSKLIAAKASIGGRADLEAAVRLAQQFPAESVFRDQTAQKLAGKLVAFGDTQCKAKKWADCAWAICRAIEVVPPAVRASIVVPAAEVELQEAEKKAARDKGFVPCRKK